MIRLRYAHKGDLPEVIRLIRELAAYERAPREVTVTLEDLEKDGFGDQPLFKVILAEESGKLHGMAFYFFAYSTWKGKCVYLEDIIVSEAHRGKGTGKMLFDAVILEARKAHAKRLMWQVLEWNETAIGFYRKYGATLDPEWLNGRLTQEQLLNIPIPAELTIEG